MLWSACGFVVVHHNETTTWYKGNRNETTTTPRQMPGEGCCKANVKQISAVLKRIAFFIYNEAKTGIKRQQQAK